MPTPKKPEIAGCTGSLRTTRSTVMAAAMPREPQIATVSPNSEFSSTKTSTGTDE
jgi:hypothetical protein